MADFGLKLPPHLVAQAKAEAEAKANRDAAEAAEAASQPDEDRSRSVLAEPDPTLTPPMRRTRDQVTVTTPLGSVTCPPGRLKLNLLDGGMPSLTEIDPRSTEA